MVALHFDSFGQPRCSIRQWPPTPGRLFACFIILGFFVGLGLLAYSPGMSGGLVFDDKPNLMPIETLGGIVDQKKLLAFLLSSDSAPSRPLSLLSFVMDDQYWPLDTYALKRTNLALHLINGLLVFWLSGLLFAKGRSASTQHWGMIGAGLCAALWLINPLQVSTVSYIIQRMTELSALFVLSGLIFYWKVRRYLSPRFWLTLALLSLGVLIFMILGLASKENALLLSLFLALLEFFFLRKESLPNKLAQLRVWQIWKGLCFAGPIVLFLLYWTIQSNGFSTGFEHRAFTLSERLLTESRILWMYVYSIFIPQMSHTGLFSDEIVLSTGLFSPVTTLGSLLGLVAWTGGAWALRNRAPLVGFGLLFFMVGHLLESTFLPLELYFEHRNYLPQWGLWVALTGLVFKLHRFVSNRIFLCGGIGYLLVSLFVTFNSAALWGNSLALAKVWHTNNPGSVRALQFLAFEFHQNGDTEKAEQLIEQGIDRFPDSLALPLTNALIKCGRAGFRFNERDVLTLARISTVETAAYESVQLLANKLSLGDTCDGLNQAGIERILLTLSENPYYSANAVTLSRILEQVAILAVERRDLNESMYYYDKACEAACSPAIRFTQAELLLSAGLLKDARDFFNEGAELLNHSVIYQHKNPSILEAQASLKARLAPYD